MLKKSFLFAAAMGIVLGAGAATLRVELSGGNKVELLPVEAPETIELRPMNWLKPSEQKFTLWGKRRRPRRNGRRRPLNSPPRAMVWS